jgi:hypothetical protein
MSGFADGGDTEPVGGQDRTGRQSSQEIGLFAAELMFKAQNGFSRLP